MRKIYILCIITFYFSSCIQNNNNNEEKHKINNEATTNVIHVTDLFRPSVDDDDHFDLACEYALAANNSINLKGVVLDRSSSRNPDVLAVAQLNYLTGLNIPLSVGIKERLRSNSDFGHLNQNQAVKMILNNLEKSKEPIVIHITGTCRDVAVAGKIRPDLFKKNCKAIYLNMGVSTNDTVKQNNLDYNVFLDPIAYQLMWDIPCSIYWMPVHDRWEPDWNIRKDIAISENSTFYRLNQNQLLPKLSDNMKKFYMFMFEKHESSDWLTYMEDAKIDTVRFNEIGNRIDEKWCTAGFIHASGQTVTENGQLVDLENTENVVPVFSFQPIKLTDRKSVV